MEEGWGKEMGVRAKARQSLRANRQRTRDVVNVAKGGRKDLHAGQQAATQRGAVQLQFGCCCWGRLYRRQSAAVLPVLLST